MENKELKERFIDEKTGIEYIRKGVNDKIRMYKKWNLTMYKNVQR